MSEPSTTIGVWIGLALASSGFGSIVYAWVKVAELINVAQQVPYIVSGGLVGLVLVVLGVTVIDVAVRRQDSHERRRQMVQMTATLVELRDLVETDEVEWWGP